MQRLRWTRMLIRAAVIVGGSGLLPVSACNGALGRQFRTAAGDSLEQGVQSIATGVLDGLFAILKPDPLAGDPSV